MLSPHSIFSACAMHLAPHALRHALLFGHSYRSASIGFANAAMMARVPTVRRGYEQRQSARKGKHPPVDPDTVGKFLQPPVHSIPGDGKRDDIGEDNPYQELP